jgi:hypothetical protein
MATNREVLQDGHPQIATRGHYGDLEVVRVDVKARTAVFRIINSGGLPVPETTAPLNMIRPLTQEDSGKLWKMLVDDLMLVLKQEGQYPTFIKGYEVTTGEDSTGEPAFYIKILVAPEQKYSPATISRWNSFSNLLQDRLIGLRLQRYPYVQIGELRRGK